MAYSIFNKETNMWVVNDSIDINRYDFEGSPSSVKERIDEVVTKATNMGMIGEGSIDITVSNGFYDSYELNIRFYFTRVENDKERKEREDREAKDKNAASEKRKAAAERRKLKKDAEFAEYERLKVKFGGL